MTTSPEPADHRRSLADLAQRDLDAALQLLAERAQYITAASGAAIALRRGDHHDMLCRASAGSNAPELGAILSMDYGLSGESVRTRQLLRCDDVASDPRVNHEVCRRLGIASVVVMPIVSDDQALGVFELLSGKPRAFEERDLSALRRLSELVEHAVKHAVIAHSMPSAAQTAAPEVIAHTNPSTATEAGTAAVEPIPSPTEEIPSEPASTAHAPVPLTSTPDAATPKTTELSPSEKTEAAAQKPEPETQPPAPLPKKPIFWSAATHPDSAPNATSAESARVPPGLRNLQKCQACGFPVSSGRTYCVECEEKQWRGQPLTKPAASPTMAAPAKTEPDFASKKIAASSTGTTRQEEFSKPETAPAKVSSTLVVAPPAASPSSLAPLDTPQPAPNTSQNSVHDIPITDHSTLFLTSSSPSQSWFSANKTVLIVLLAVAIVIAAIALLR